MLACLARNLLQENGRTLPEVVNDEDKEHATFFVTWVKHFHNVSARKGAQRWRVGPHFRHLELDLSGDEKVAINHGQIKHLYIQILQVMGWSSKWGMVPSPPDVAPSIPGVAGLQRSWQQDVEVARQVLVHGLLKRRRGHVWNIMEYSFTCGLNV